MALDPAAGAPAVQAYLIAYRRRIRRSRRVLYLGRAALAAGAAWLLAALLYYLDAAPAWLGPAGLALTALLVAGALGIEAWRRPSLAQTAALLDAHLDNRQRLVTAVELLAATPQPAFAPAQLASTAQLLARADPRAVYPVRRRGPLFGAGLGLLCLALGLFLLKGVPAGFTPLQAGRLSADQAAAGAVLSPTPQSGLPGAPTPLPQDAGVLPVATPAVGTPAAPKDPADAARQVAASQAAQAGLDRLAQSLGQQSITQAAADDLRAGRYDAAAQELANVGEQSDQLSHAAKQSLAKALDQAANDPATSPALRSAERKAADALRSGDYASVARSLKDLGAAARQAGNAVVSQQQLAQSYPTPAPGPGGQGQQDQQGQQAQQGQQDQGATAGQNDATGQEGQAGSQGDAGQGDLTGEAQGDGGSGEGEGSGGGAGQGTRVSGPSEDQPLGATGNPFELENRPAPGQDPDTPPDTPPGVSVDANGSTGGAGAPGQGAPIAQPGEDPRLPVERWQLIQRYFSPEQ